MRELPMLCATDMAQAILDLRKTETRRIKGLEVINQDPDNFINRGSELTKTERQAFCRPGLTYFKLEAKDKKRYAHTLKDGTKYGISVTYVRPPYEVGDRLWVRESFWEHGQWSNDFPRPKWMRDPRQSVHFVAGHPEKPHADIKSARQLWRKKPGIHLFKKDVRTWLQVTRIRLERLRDIDEDGAWREGFHSRVMQELGDTQVAMMTAWGCFRVFWNQLNAKRGYGWDVNPWVWVILFRLKPFDVREEMRKAITEGGGGI